jgi:hypothetical protein
LPICVYQLAVSVISFDSREMFSRITGAMSAMRVPSTWNVRLPPPRVTKAQHRVHVTLALAFGVACLLAEVGLVHLYDLAGAAHGRNKVALAHRFTQAMHHEPCRLVADLEGAMDLMGADALLGARHQEQSGEPLCQGELRALKHSLDRDRELFAAIVALIHAGAVRLTTEPRSGQGAAMRTDRAFRPDPSLKPLTGLGFVLEDRVLEDGRKHD